MRRFLLIYLIIATFLFVISGKIGAQEINITVSADQLMAIALNKARNNDKLKQEHLSYDEVSILDEFNYKGEKTSTQRSAKTISGKRSSFAGLDLGIGELIHLLVLRHQFSFANPEKIVLNNKTYWVIEFWPKQDLIDTTTQDKFINRLQGKIFLDAQNYSLLGVETHIPEEKEFSFKVWRFFVFVTINVKGFKLKFQQTEHQGIMVENKIELEARFIVLSSTRTRKYDYQYGNYRFR